MESDNMSNLFTTGFVETGDFVRIVTKYKLSEMQKDSAVRKGIESVLIELLDSIKDTE